MRDNPPFILPDSVPKFLHKTINHVVDMKSLEKIYSIALRKSTNNFLTNILRAMNVRVNADRHELMRISKKGACVVVANHPFGGIEGIALTECLLTLRSDVKVVANSLLAQIPELHPYMIFVNPFGDKGAVAKNLSGLRQMISWVKNGGMLVVFPAGEVASFSVKDFSVNEGKWNRSIASIIKVTNAQVVPCFVHGKNSLSFYTAGILYPRLRTLLLGRELINKKNRTIQIRFGSAISNNKIRMFGNDEEVIQKLRSSSLLLRFKPAEEKIDMLPQLVSLPIDDAITGNILENEIQNLPSECLFIRHAEYEVYCVTAQQIPSTLQEIGRLREVTYRFAGEGTGRTSDNDTFDTWYEHLFIWNTKKKEVVGSYRIGRCDEILTKVGAMGLYTNSLFELKQSFLTKVTPSLELGRSFVRVEYQKSYIALMLLWKAIGEFLVRNPQYRYLFGPVSISNEYSKSSLRLLLNSLMVFHYNRSLSKTITPRTPLTATYFQNWDGLIQPYTQLPLDEIDEVISELEHDKKGVPVLFRQYMKLGGKILAFNRDENFNNAIDALLVVDLEKTDKRIIAKFINAKQEVESVTA